MIQLPSNLTTASLALLLGLLVGAGGYHLLFSSSGDDVHVPEGEGKAVLQRDREIAPEDTAGQSEPEVEIRYKTKVDTVRDSIRVPVPTSLPKVPMLSDRTPIEVGPDEVTWSYYNPQSSQWEQKLYTVPTQRWELSVYAVARAPVGRLTTPKRIRVGPSLRVRRNRLSAHVSLLTTPTLKRPRAFVGFRYKL